MNTLLRDGVKLGYTEAGRNSQPGAPPLLFVHGWCCDHSYFEPQFRHFSARHRVVAVGQRGFGQSNKPMQAYTIEGFADDLAWWIDALGLERPIVVGHSMGG